MLYWDVTPSPQCMAVANLHPLKKILTSDHYSLALAHTMSRGPGTPKEEIIAADEQAPVCLYNEKHGESLDALCYSCFQEKVARSSKYVEAKEFATSCCSNEIHVPHSLSLSPNRALEGKSRQPVTD